MSFKIRHGGLEMEFSHEDTSVKYDHLPDSTVITIDIGEDAIQNLMLYLFQGQAKTTEQFQECMKSVREFYSHYLMDRSALNMLATQIRLLNP